MNNLLLFQSLLSPGDLVFDVGAHDGKYALMFSELVGSGGAVHAFEPHPHIFSGLKRRAAHCSNKNIHARPYAVSDKMGEVTLFFGETENTREASTICQELAIKERLGDTIAHAQVESITLDHYASSNRLKPTFVKIDVEGAESRVFSGMRDMLVRQKPRILFECGFEKELPPHFEMLRSMGYLMRLVDIFRFFPPDFSANTVQDSSSRLLADKIISFDDDRLSDIGPALANVLCVHERDAIHLPILKNTIALEEAIKLLARPKKRLGAILSTFLPYELILKLRMTRHKITK